MQTWLRTTAFGEHRATVKKLMATYAEIRKFIKLALDVDPAMTNDQTTDLIDFHISRVLLEVLSLVRPMEVFSESLPVTVDSTTTEIDIATDFSVTSYAAIHGVSVDTDFAETGIRKDLMWTPVSYPQWIGRDLDDEYRKWTQTPDGEVILSSWPEDAYTWNVYLWYYRLPAAITDLGVPEIPAEFHLSTLVPGVVLAFPHRFTGSREQLLAMYSKMYGDGLAAIMRNRKVKSLQNLFRPIGKGQIGNVSVLPDWQSS